MTFLDLQRQITQTRKARKGVKNKRDYFKYATIEEEMTLKEMYKKALRAANEVIKYYAETGEFDPNEKFYVVFGEKSKSDKSEIESLKKEKQKLQEEFEILKNQLEKFYRGGRKSYDDAMIQRVKSARDNGETWRGLAARIGISTTTAQKLYRMR